MSTGTEIIEAALAEGKVVSVLVPSSPEQITDGMHKLNSLIQMWVTQDIFLNIQPLKSAGDQLDEPIDVRNALVFNLAIILANLYSFPVTVDLKRQASKTFGVIERNYKKLDIPEKVVSSTLPRGQGQNKGVDPQIFKRKGSTVNG